MSRDDDEYNAYRTDEDMVGRSIRRGTEKGLRAVGGAILGSILFGPVGGLLGAALSNLKRDAIGDAAKVLDRADEYNESSDD